MNRLNCSTSLKRNRLNIRILFHMIVGRYPPIDCHRILRSMRIVNRMSTESVIAFLHGICAMHIISGLVYSTQLLAFEKEQGFSHSNIFGQNHCRRMVEIRDSRLTN